MSDTIWTDPRVERLKGLWAEGHSAAEIAEQLGGVTRNAVLGKLHRLKLLGGRKPQPGAPRPKRSGRRIPRRPPQRFDQAPTAPSSAAAAPVHAELPGETATLEALHRHQCHWPVGDPKAEDFAFCGGRVSRGPYCAAHRAIAYAAAAPHRGRRRTPKAGR